MADSRESGFLSPPNTHNMSFDEFFSQLQPEERQTVTQDYQRAAEFLNRVPALEALDRFNTRELRSRGNLDIFSLYISGKPIVGSDGLWHFPAKDFSGLTINWYDRRENQEHEDACFLALTMSANEFVTVMGSVPRDGDNPEKDFPTVVQLFHAVTSPDRQIVHAFELPERPLTLSEEKTGEYEGQIAQNISKAYELYVQPRPINPPQHFAA